MSFTDLFAILVVRHKVMTMAEFYNADFFDINLVCSHLEEVERDALERMRHIVWAVLAPNSKRKITPTDVMQFSWEKPGHGEASEVTTKEMFDKMFKNFKKAQ
jgi:hypothetical protein